MRVGRHFNEVQSSPFVDLSAISFAPTTPVASSFSIFLLIYSRDTHSPCSVRLDGELLCVSVLPLVHVSEQPLLLIILLPNLVTVP